MDARRDATEFERLLTHSRWLTQLARSLVRDSAAADDLVQETWHAALRHSDERVTSERGWLASLLSNFARARARSETARRQRERAVAVSESIEGPDRLVERAEAQRNLLARVLELDEPYRSTVLARYAQGATSAEIARQTGVNESTVRTRLARAHEQLRERIERREGGLKALAPLLLAPSAQSPVGVNDGANSSAATIGTGAAIMGIGLKIGVAAAVTLCAWLAWREFTPRGEQLAVSVSSAQEPALGSLDAPLTSLDTRVALTAVETPAPTVEPKPPEPAAPVVSVEKTTLEIRVVRDLIPAAGVSVWIAPADDWPIQYCLQVKPMAAPKSARMETTNRSGTATFIDLDPRVYDYRVGFDTGASPSSPTRFITTALFAGHAYEIRLGSATIRGRAYDALGRTRTQGGLYIGNSKPDANHFHIAAICALDEQGQYVVGDLAAGSYELTMETDRFDGWGEVQRTRVELREGETKQVDFGTPSPSPKWSGRLLNASLEPMPGRAVRLVNEKSGREFQGVLDEAGRFEIAFEPGTWRVFARAAGEPNGGFDLGTVELPARDLVRDLVVRGARLLVHLDEPIEPRAANGSNWRFVNVRPKGHDYPAAFRDTTWRDDGVRVIDGLEPGVWTIGVHPGSFAEGETVDVTIGPDQALVEVKLHWKAP